MPRPLCSSGSELPLPSGPSRSSTHTIPRAGTGLTQAPQFPSARGLSEDTAILCPSNTQSLETKPLLQESLLIPHLSSPWSLAPPFQPLVYSPVGPHSSLSVFILNGKGGDPTEGGKGSLEAMVGTSTIQPDFNNIGRTFP